METGDVLALGALGLGGYFAWKWWRSRPVSNAQQDGSTSRDAVIASQMHNSAARTTTFGGSMFQRLLAAPTTSYSARRALPAATAPAESLAAIDKAAFRPVLRQVLGNTVFAPTTTAPSPNAFIFTDVNVLAPRGTAPAGELPTPGDPTFSSKGIL